MEARIENIKTLSEQKCAASVRKVERESTENRSRCGKKKIFAFWKAMKLN